MILIQFSLLVYFYILNLIKEIIIWNFIKINKQR